MQLFSRRALPPSAVPPSEARRPPRFLRRRYCLPPSLPSFARRSHRDVRRLRKRTGPITWRSRRSPPACSTDPPCYVRESAAAVAAAAAAAAALSARASPGAGKYNLKKQPLPRGRSEEPDVGARLVRPFFADLERLKRPPFAPRLPGVAGSGEAARGRRASLERVEGSQKKEKQVAGIGASLPGVGRESSSPKASFSPWERGGGIKLAGGGKNSAGKKLTASRRRDPRS